jgi:hypothetical protein
MLCLGMHSNVMHRFRVQAFQDPPLCSSIDEIAVVVGEIESKIKYYSITEKTVTNIYALYFTEMLRLSFSPQIKV